MRYIGRKIDRGQEAHAIAAVAPAEQVEDTQQSVPVARSRFRDRLSQWRDEHPVIGQGLDAGYDYAPSVASAYQGPLRQSDEYVEVFEVIDEHGFAPFLNGDEVKPDASARLWRRSGLRK